MKGMKSILNPSHWGRFPILAALLWGICAYGQGHTITGRAFNEAGKKIGPVRIVLYDLDKKKVVDFDTPGSGKFKLRNIPDGNYTMNIYGEDGYSGTENISVSGSNIADLKPIIISLDDQPQVKVKPGVGIVELNWRKTPGAVGFIVYRDNNEVGQVNETIYEDKVEPGQTYAYNVVPLNSDQSKGSRSITEFGKALMPALQNIVTEARKNIVKLSWDAMGSATAYNVYRDGKMVNSTSENSYMDFKLKYGTEFAYTVAALDHQGDEGARSAAVFATTHPEVRKPVKLNAESGTGEMTLTWKSDGPVIQYYIYQNGTLVDSTTELTISITTAAGDENCFSVSGIDQYGTQGPKSDPACDKSMVAPPDSIQVTNFFNQNTLTWAAMSGASSYNIYRNGKMLSNTANLVYKDKGLKWDKEFKYHMTSMTRDGVEGPESETFKVKVPAIYIVEGLLLDEMGTSKNVDQAKVFLYSKGGKLRDEYLVSRNGKFRFEKAIISGEYTVKAYGNGSGNGGARIHVKTSHIKDLKIKLSTEGLRPTISVERGVRQLTINWNDLPAAKSYVVYKNNRLIATITDDTTYLDPDVAPGIPTTYDVRTIDVYDLEGPKSNEVTEKSSFKHPELTPLVVSGVYTKDGSGRHINLSWQPVAGVNNYALYRDGTLLSKQAETTYEDTDTKYATTYIYEINSIDNDNIEGVNSPKIPVNTHIEVLVPNFKLTPVINAISLDWPSLETSVNYKIFRNGSNIADTPDTSFIDNVKPGKEYCYSVAAEDNYQTVGPQADIQCGKAYYAPPGNFNGQVIRNEVSLSWTVVLGASGYHLYRNNELIFETIDATEFLDEGLEFDSDYTYEICSHDQDVYEGPKVVVQIKTHEEVLATEVTGESDLQKISLSWKKSILVTEHRYRIYRDAELLDETTDTSYQDFVPAGQFFCYIITVVDHYGTESEKSNEECHKVLVSSPKNLVITGDVKRVMFEWKKMTGAEIYNIYTVDKNTESKTLLTKTKQGFYEHKDLEFDKEYCYKVSCVDADGDEGPLSPVQCGWVLPPPHITLIEKRFVEGSGNKILDGREHGWIIATIVNDGRSPARELKPWLEPIGDAITPSLKIDSVAMTPKLDMGDTLTIHFPIYAKLKIESGERNFNIRVGEFTGLDLEPEPISFTTLKVIAPNLVVTDFAIDNEWGQHYIPKNEMVTFSVRVQNLSEGKSDTVSVRFRRDSSFVSEDADELHQFGFVNAGEYLDFKFEIMSREDKFTVYIELYDYFETQKTIPLHLETMKKYKGADDLIIVETPYPDDLTVGAAPIIPELMTGIPKGSTERGTIGIVLGNLDFWNPEIPGKSSTSDNVRMVREYFHDLFGMEDHAIIPSQFWLFSERISSRDLQAIFDPDLGYLRKKIESNLDYSGQKSLDLILYYSGEGTTFRGEKVLIPYDADLKNQYSFFSINKLYSNLIEIQKMEEVGEITLFMDVDFNNSAFQQYIVKTSAEEEDPKAKKKKKKKKKKKGEPEEPVARLPKEIMPPESITAFYASNTTQITYDHPDMNNGIFTYYLLRGLRGEADNGDKKVTIAELHEYISKHVQDTTGKLYKDLPQVPQLFSSNPDRVLYRLP